MVFINFELIFEFLYYFIMVKVKDEDREDWMSNDLKEESVDVSENESENDDGNGYEADSFVVEDDSESEFMEEDILK